MQWDLAGSSLGDSPKGLGSSLGVCREIIGRRPDDLPQEWRRLPDWRKLGLSLSLWYFRQLTHPGPVGKLPEVNRPYPGVWAAKLPRSVDKSLVPDFFGYI
ncbi:hypothetical protein BHE74_00023120 [Ensete ventricosum]|nr:hypothetical protein BHE74_00023120 [Ensete ventricosum]